MTSTDNDWSEEFIHLVASCYLEVYAFVSHFNCFLVLLVNRPLCERFWKKLHESNQENFNSDLRKCNVNKVPHYCIFGVFWRNEKLLQLCARNTKCLTPNYIMSKYHIIIIFPWKNVVKYFQNCEGCTHCCFMRRIQAPSAGRWR